VITFLLYLLAFIVGIWVGKLLEDDPVWVFIIKLFIVIIVEISFLNMLRSYGVNI
jgi:hypothetical protein